MANELIKWNHDIYSVGIEKIDNQHKKLVDIINKLFDSFSKGKAEEVVSEILEELSQYTEYHFKTEEEYFEKYQYPDRENHIRQHKDFIKKLDEWKKQNNEKKSDIHYSILDFLKKWLPEHILKEDKSYEKFLKDKI